jgi:hypothetical protein
MYEESAMENPQLRLWNKDPPDYGTIPRRRHPSFALFCEPPPPHARFQAAAAAGFRMVLGYDMIRS